MQMTDALHHRGPDDSGVYINDDKSVALGHRRLSILDLTSHGHQPMSTEDERIWVIYNGEIYNFREMRSELQQLGHIFNSDSDTEVILKAYREWGENSFEKLNGMFAFSIYDKQKNLLFLARDHAGIKPLYYSFTGKSLIFSSEIKALKVFDKNWEEFEDWKIYFLIFGHIPEPVTTLKNVFMLPKSSFLKIDVETGKYEIAKYTEISFTDKIKDEQEAIELVRTSFTKAVERHLISDAPIGVFLSGGIDSSLIALLANKFLGKNLRTLSVVFNEKEYSEENYQNIVLQKIKSRHNSYLVTEKDFIENLDDIFSAMDQPTIDGVNTYFIAKCAKEEGLKAVLSGLGGDELFGGYASFSRINKIMALRHATGRMKNVFKLCEYLPNDRLKKLAYLSISGPLSYYLILRGLFSPAAVSAILDCSESAVYSALERIDFNVKEGIGKLNLVSHMETDLYMKNQLLKDSDVMGMTHSVEIRVPFLDKQFMEDTFSISEKVKFNKGKLKYLLVKAFEDILPDEIVRRSKQGFTFPFDSWIKNQGGKLLDETISSQTINRKHVERLWGKFQDGKLHWSRIWSCIVVNNSTGHA